MLRAPRLVALAAISACLVGTAGTLFGPGAAAVVSSGVPAAATPRVSPPASFTFSGAGWGHGVGLSQYGALGQAREGRTAEQIVRHYYTGTVVAPVRDDMDLRINLRHRAAKVVVRGEALATGGGRTEVTLTGVRVMIALVPAGTVITVRAYLTGVAVTLTPRVGPSRLLGTGQKAYVRWSGSRVAGSAGTAASLLNVTTTVAGLANAGHRYRYGFLQIAPTIGAPTTLEAVNFERAHDEY